jgi:flavin reductase (DIM6/NTAB) family NADH-FMN oxidoreductase RutF/uncharacterized protein YciI
VATAGADKISVPVDKISLSLDKRDWHPSVLPGQIVLVSTVDGEGTPNFAPKSWVMMAAFDGPRLAFGCDTNHRTCANILETGEFVVNVPAEALAEEIWDTANRHGAERLDATRFTLRSAQMVAPPLLEECSAHLECRLDDVKRYGAEVVIFGRVVAASIDSRCVDGERARQYFRLRPLFFLEGGTYASLDTAKKVGASPPTRQMLFVVELGEPAEPATDAHVEFLQQLRASGALLLAGAFDEASGNGGGMYVVEAESLAAAKVIVHADPLVTAGAAVRVRQWTRSF